MRSRVFSSIEFLNKISVPIGITLNSYLIDLIPVYIIIICISLLSLGTTLIFLTTTLKEIFIID